MSFDFYKGKTVLVTGHTGFKGAWLCEWLLSLGANVHGYALEPNTSPSLFEQLDLASRIASHSIGDVCDLALLKQRVCQVQPDLVFHLAAQPLVRLSYECPVETMTTNALGTVHLLEAVRSLTKPCAVVCITTDKCYENKEWLHSYRESDPMGGYDPYSASKGMAELAIAAYRQSFFGTPKATTWIASARAGNVIGGGDWALDRIIPDCIRALKQGTVIPVRNKVATRPWQHVLEPLSGYLMLGERLYAGVSTQDARAYHMFARAFNFGPTLLSNKTVYDLIVETFKTWQGEWVDASDPNAVHEAHLLNLSIDNAYHMLAWTPKWDFESTISRTIGWYKAEFDGASPRMLCLEQIDAFQRS